MDDEKLIEAFERLYEACQEFTETLIEVFKPVIQEVSKKIEDFLDLLRETVDKEERQKWRFPVKKNKKDYLHNQKISAYRIDRQPIKNLRRNY